MNLRNAFGLISALILLILMTANSQAQLIPVNGGSGDPGVWWDPDSVVVIETHNSALCMTSELGEPLAVLPVVNDHNLGPGYFAFTVNTLDGYESKLIRGIVDVDGFTTLYVVEMNINDALAFNSLFNVSIGHSGIGMNSWNGWNDFWSGYWHYLTNPWEMDDDLETGFYICGGVGGGAAVAAGGVAVAGVGGTVITTEMIVGAGIVVGKEVADELVDQGVSAATGGVVPGLPTSATDLVQGIASGGIKKIIKRRPNPGADGGDSVHIIEKINDQTISVTHRVEVIEPCMAN